MLLTIVRTVSTDATRLGLHFTVFVVEMLGRGDFEFSLDGLVEEDATTLVRPLGWYRKISQRGSV